MSKKRLLVILLITFNVIIGLAAIIGIVYLLAFNTTVVTDNTPIVTTTPEVVTPTAVAYNPAVNFQFTLANLPRIDGSTSNVPLRSFIICELLDYQCAWQEYSGEDEVITQRFVDINTSSANLDIIRQRSVNSTTHNAYVKLINGETDIIFVATLPSADERALMAEEGVELTIQPIAMDAFVFIVNKNNDVYSLTSQEVLDIYTGEITNWSELGGDNRSINAYQREDNSGSQELMELLVLKGETPIEAPEMIIQGMIGLINQVADDEYGLGYSVYYYEQFMVRNTDLQVVSINGIEPTFETLDNETYPFISPVYIVTRKDLDTNSSAYNLAQWMLTRAGQKVVLDSGYVPIVKE